MAAKTRAQRLERRIGGGEIDAVFRAAFGFPARQADREIVAMMGGTAKALAEYVWDHWMGKEGGIRGLRRVENAVLEVVETIEQPGACARCGRRHENDTERAACSRREDE